jgi:enoyl-CoA hydratase/carnithine racemase
MKPAYFNDYPNIALQRDAQGILEMRLHTQDGPLKFSASARTQLMEACHAVGRDRDNRLVIFTGTGDTWCGEFDKDPAAMPDPALSLAQRWDKQFWEGRKLLQNMLDIEVPMIAAVNGPALIHSEYLLTCDIILAADNAAFQDLPHLNNNVSPTDGVHVLWPHVLGPGRGRYFLLTQQKLSANEALTLGVCQEVLPRDKLMVRAYEIASRLATQPTSTLRFARVGLTQRLKRLVVDDLAIGLAVEALSALHKAMDPPKS